MNVGPEFAFFTLKSVQYDTGPYRLAKRSTIGTTD